MLTTPSHSTTVSTDHECIECSARGVEDGIELVSIEIRFRRCSIFGGPHDE